MTEETDFHARILAAYQPAATTHPTDAYLSGFFVAVAVAVHEEREDVYVRLEELHQLVLAHLAAARAGNLPPMGDRP